MRVERTPTRAPAQPETLCPCGCKGVVPRGATYAHRGCANRSRQYTTRRKKRASMPLVVAPRREPGPKAEPVEKVSWWLKPEFQQDRDAFQVEALRRHPVASDNRRPMTPRKGARSPMQRL